MHIHTNKSVTLTLLCSCGFLLAIWTLPETIALRHMLLIVGFSASLIYLKGHIALFFKLSAWPIWLVIGFYVWLVIHLIFFSHEFELQLLELQGLWVRALLATFSGLGLGLILTDENNQHPSSWTNLNLGIFFLGLCGCGLICLGAYVYSSLVTHEWSNFDFLLALYRSKPPFVIATALLAPMCFIVIIRSSNHEESIWWSLAATFGIGLTLFCIFFSNTKNGIACFAITLLIFLFTFLKKMLVNAAGSAVILFATLIILCVSIPAIQKHIELNNSWLNLIQNARVGLDIHHQNYWKNRDVYLPPKNDSGNSVDISTYERTAWFIAGSELLKENPLGFGLSHHSFGWLALKKWPDFYQPIGNLRGATHSGWMDMALAFGIPGILLILLPLFCAWYRALHQEGIWFTYTSWTIPTITFAYLTTEANGKHFTEMLFFMIAFFCGLTLRRSKIQERST